VKTAVNRAIMSILALILLLGGSVWAQEVVPLPNSGVLQEQPSDAFQEVPPVFSQTEWTENAQYDKRRPGCHTCPNHPGRRCPNPCPCNGPLGPCADDGSGYNCAPEWYVNQGVRIMFRSHARSKGGNISYYAPVFGGEFVTQLKQLALTTRFLSMDVQAGYEITFGHYLGRDSGNRDQFIEFEYYGSFNWNVSRAAQGERVTLTDGTIGDYEAGNLISPFRFTPFPAYDSGVGGFNRADTHVISYKSQLNNFELNLLFKPRIQRDRLVLHPNGRWRRERQHGTHLSYVAGARWLILGEWFDFDSNGNLDLPGGSDNPTSGHYSVRTHNDVLGFHIGADCVHHKDRWDLGFSCKLGPAINIADQITTTHISAINDPEVLPANQIVNRFRSRQKTGISGALEIGTSVGYRVRPNLVLHAAYDLMWVGGLALAPEQIDYYLDAPAAINKNGYLFYQSLSLKAECQW